MSYWSMIVSGAGIWVSCIYNTANHLSVAMRSNFHTTLPSVGHRWSQKRKRGRITKEWDMCRCIFRSRRLVKWGTLTGGKLMVMMVLFTMTAEQEMFSPGLVLVMWCRVTGVQSLSTQPDFQSDHQIYCVLHQVIPIYCHYLIIWETLFIQM